ncbi:hypothetical protein ACFLVK_01250 [Chloroflexota bacterium]
MGKGPSVTPQIKNLIKEIYRQDKTIGATAACKKLRKRMKKEGLDKNFGPHYPDVSTVDKYLKGYKKKEKERSPESLGLDGPWSFGSLAEYPIPPDAIELVVSIYEKCLMEGSEKWLLTTREALWVGRLYKIIKMYYRRGYMPPAVSDEILSRINKAFGDNDQELINKLRELEGKENPNQEYASFFGLTWEEIPVEDIILEWAYEYAAHEEMGEIEGEPFDTSDLDTLGTTDLDVHLMGNICYNYGERRDNFMEQIVEDYDVDPYEIDKLTAHELTLGALETASSIVAQNDIRIFRIPHREWKKSV